MSFGPAKILFELEQRVAALEEQLRRDPTPDAEPPGTPTVQEPEDSYPRERAADQPRRECWEIRNQEGLAVARYDLESTASTVIELFEKC